jgi:hypothetical protein
MRIVAKYQFVSVAPLAGGISELSDILQQWGDSKFAHDENRSTIIKKSGLSAIFDHQTETVDDSSQVIFDALEPVADGQLQMQVKLLKTAGQTNFQCTLSLGSESGLLPPTINIRSPRFIRQIVDLPAEWRVAKDAERVFSKCFEVNAKEVGELERLIRAPQRRLPVIVVSELHGETLAGDIHERIGNDTCGLAHTCRLTNDASWELTNVLGKEWSCYNGAIRLFWPFRVNRDDPRAHPLWTIDRLLWKTNDEAKARDWFRGELSERLIEASTFVSDDPAFARFEAAKVHSVSKASRVSAEGDYKAIADSYASENDALRGILETQLQEIETLKQNVESLTIALRSEKSISSQQHVQESPPESVLEAVQTAQKKLSQTVAFPEDIDDQIKTLNTAAGPPDKILRYLLTLGDLALTLEDKNALGRSIPIWLRDQGVDCSGESDTIKKSKGSKRQRTFRINGNECHCEYHAKPSDGVHPDLCVRIYFTVSDQAPRVRVGYVGRHFE